MHFVDAELLSCVVNVPYARFRGFGSDIKPFGMGEGRHAPRRGWLKTGQAEAQRPQTPEGARRGVCGRQDGENVVAEMRDALSLGERPRAGKCFLYAWWGQVP